MLHQPGEHILRPLHLAVLGAKYDDPACKSGDSPLERFQLFLGCLQLI